MPSEGCLVKNVKRIQCIIALTIQGRKGKIQERAKAEGKRARREREDRTKDDRAVAEGYVSHVAQLHPFLSFPPPPSLSLAATHHLTTLFITY